LLAVVAKRPKELRMDHNIEKQVEKVSARRRLIRGAFAAPAALTLYSGSSMAAVSVTCLGRQTNSPTLPTPTAASSDDVYVRVQLKKFTRTGTGSGVNIGTNTNRWSRWVQGTDVAAFQASGRTNYLPTGNWQLYDRGLTASTNIGSAYRAVAIGTIYTTAPVEATDASSGTSAAVLDQWVALRVDASGNIKGVVGIANGAGESAISRSCWTSVRLSPP
jgi:hypothetical protein